MISRRNSRAPRRMYRSGSPLFNRVLRAGQGKPHFDNYNVDEDETNPGFIRKFIDWNDPTHFLDQSSAALQVAMPTAHVDFSGALCSTFTAQHYISNRTAASWSGLHNGSGDQLVLVFTSTGGSSTRRPCGTRATGTTVGFVLSFDSAPNAAAFYGNGTANLSLAPAVGGAPLNTPSFLRSQLLGSAPTATGRLWHKGTLISTVGSYSPSAAAPVGSFVLGAATGGTGPTPMRFAALIVWPATASVDLLHKYLFYRYNISA